MRLMLSILTLLLLAAVNLAVGRWNPARLPWLALGELMILPWVLVTRAGGRQGRMPDPAEREEWKWKPGASPPPPPIAAQVSGPQRHAADAPHVAGRIARVPTVDPWRFDVGSQSRRPPARAAPPSRDAPPIKFPSG